MLVAYRHVSLSPAEKHVYTLHEVKKCSKPDGLLICSLTTPDTVVYAQLGYWLEEHHDENERSGY